MVKFWKKERPPEIERQIIANDPEHNAQYEYANNYISTSKYTILTFVPKNLLEQFQRIANAYFLFLLILQLIPQVSSLPFYTTLAPLAFVLLLSAIKDAIDDILLPWISSLTPLTTAIPFVAVLTISAVKDAVDDVQRHNSDNTVNNRKSHVLRDGQIIEEAWHKVVVGDIIKMENNQFVAADLLLLSTSEPNSLCYIETAELDGETNLKVKQAIPETAEMGDDLDLCTKFDAKLICEAPNNHLSKFQGTLKFNGEQYAVDNEKILLRGCVLRNTKWCYGLVVFAGQDTKLMQNSGKTKFKRTHLDRLMNKLIIGIFMFLCAMCLICTISCGVWETVFGFQFQQYLPWESYVPSGKEAGATTISLLVFLSYIIILNTVVPISLYVSVEMIRFINSMLINWDSKMYHAKTDTPAKARTTTLNEELGQIEYIFSDKTGTLTQNIMTFNKCSINCKAYGDIVDPSGIPIEITERTQKVDFSENPYYDNNFVFYDNRLPMEIRKGNKDVHEFFILLALCHTVMAEDKDGKLEYQAQSPDEEALVSAAMNFGFVFKSRTPNTITIEVNGQSLVYELLNILDFNNVRKRMSVILRKDGKIKLLCKGADSIVYKRLDPSSRDLMEVTNHHLNDFAQDGLRTLCLAEKDIDAEYYSNWKRRFHAASTSMEDRDAKVDVLYEEIEMNMRLLGVTAIEDKLQDGVPEAIANLALAGIKIWVLTGDKQETAINIGYSCRLLTDEMEEIFIVDGESYQEVFDQMEKALHQIRTAGTNKVDGVTFANTTKSVSDSTLDEFEDQCGSYALVINGHSLVHALKKDMEKLLLDLGTSCKAVICCRVTPLQKAMVVDLIKTNKKALTLSIGDGANDVSMIKTAHIGVGISGQEGMQAVLSSDYSIAQFRYLERLLLVHGRWSYLRMCKFLKYFFYKNFAFTLCNFWYAFFSGFSAQTLFEEFFISLYNVFYTSLPVLALAIFDQDVDEDYSVRYPKLYTPGLRDLLFNTRVFLRSVLEGVLTSLVLFFIPYGAFYFASDPWGKDVGDLHCLGVAVASILIVAVNIRCGIDTAYWTGFNHFVIWGSIVFYYCLIIAMYADVFGYYYAGTAFAVFSQATFWFTLILVNVILLVPVIAYRFYRSNITPTLSDRVRLKQRIRQAKSRSKDFPRRFSSTRRSTRSIRSGYAFSHQEGFGELIMSGTNMHQRVKDSADGVTLKAVTRINSASIDIRDRSVSYNNATNGSDAVYC